MSYLVSLRLDIAGRFERTRGWFRRSLWPQTGHPNDDRGGNQDDLYEIFLFGPHG